MPRSESNSRGAQALREAGFVKLPGFWVPVAMRDAVVAQAEKYLNQINWIKNQAQTPDEYDTYP